MYASDITRTYPANGRFTDPQKDLYTAVLNAQKAVLKQCTVENRTSMQELQSMSGSRIAVHLTLLTRSLPSTRGGAATDWIQAIDGRPAAQRIGTCMLGSSRPSSQQYPHYVSHHLGSDLHDCSTYDRNATLVAGNVITVEPGIYVPDKPDFPKHFHGMGIRIEDEVAFTDKGLLVLSANAPKEVVDVEGACQGLLDTA